MNTISDAISNCSDDSSKSPRPRLRMVKSADTRVQDQQEWYQLLGDFEAQFGDYSTQFGSMVAEQDREGLLRTISALRAKATVIGAHHLSEVAREIALEIEDQNMPLSHDVAEPIQRLMTSTLANVRALLLSQRR